MLRTIDQITNTPASSKNARLETLREMNLVSLLDPGSGTTTYEWSTPERPHHHLVCRECEGVMEIELPALVRVQGQIREGTGFEPDFDHLGISGVCASCAAKQ